MTANKTILFVAPTAYPLGGVAVWLNYILPGLQDMGWNVVLGLVSGQFHNAENYIKHYPFTNTIEISNPTGTRYGRVQAIQQAILEVTADIIVSVNIIDAFEAASQVKVKRNKKLKMVMTLHGLEVDYFEDIKKSLGQLDAVVTTNKLTAKMVNKYCQFKNDRIYYAPYGVTLDTKTLSEKKISTLEPNEPIQVLYAGRIAEAQKRISDLIQLVKALEQKACPYQLLIAGDGPSRKGILKQLRSVCHIGSIDYLGSLNQQQLFEQAYHKADVLVITSEWETGPIVAWEAMANSVAVVTSRYIGCRVENALVNKQNCLMFDIGEMQQAAKHIIALRNQSVRKKLVRNGLKLIEERYSKQSSIEQWNTVMQTILSDKRQKLAVLLNESWSKSGRLERCFGHIFAHKVRGIFKRSALVNDAGGEWPHSYTGINSQLNKNFIDMMSDVENEA